MNHFNLWEAPEAGMIARWQNTLQRYAEQTRLGIPVTLASDPRSHFSQSIFAMKANDFSLWCESLALPRLAIRSWSDNSPTSSAASMWPSEFGWPCIPKSTSPPSRAGRVAGTFGEDARLTAALATAYIAGFPAKRLAPTAWPA